MATDRSRIETKATVKGYFEPKQLPDCLKDCEVVLIPVEVLRKPGVTQDDICSRPMPQLWLPWLLPVPSIALRPRSAPLQILLTPPSQSQQKFSKNMEHTTQSNLWGDNPGHCQSQQLL